MAREEYIEVEPNVHLYITDMGKGKPIIFLPNWPVNNGIYENQYRDLINNNFRVIGITLRGFGKSDKPYGSYNYDVHASDIKKVLEKLKIKDAVLGGFSMGGAIALRFAAKDNGTHISKLALFGAAAPLWTQRKDFPYNHPQSVVDELIEMNIKDRPRLLAYFSRIFSGTEIISNQGIGSWLTGFNISASFHAMAQSLIALRDTDLRSDLSKISIPTMIMHGRKDKICSFDLAEQMKAGISNSHIIDFERSGHCLLKEEAHKFHSELIKFARK